LVLALIVLVSERFRTSRRSTISTQHLCPGRLPDRPRRRERGGRIRPDTPIGPPDGQNDHRYDLNEGLPIASTETESLRRASTLGAAGPALGVIAATTRVDRCNAPCCCTGFS